MNFKNGDKVKVVYVMDIENDTGEVVPISLKIGETGTIVYDVSVIHGYEPYYKVLWDIPEGEDEYKPTVMYESELEKI